MSSTLSAVSELSWFEAVLGMALPAEGGAVTIRGTEFVLRDGLLRERGLASASQAQTSDAFGFKWRRRESYDSPAMLGAIREWLVERYGSPDEMEWLFNAGRSQLLLDAGCGSAVSALELFGERLNRAHYIGADISVAAEVARQRFAERGIHGRFLQCDLMRLPFAAGSLDAIFSEGVLHHTDSTRDAILTLARLLRPGGRFMFYVYNKKSPIREFSDDLIRDKLQGMSPDAAWEALMPLTKLGIALGELDVEVDVPQDVALLGIPKGKINLQRLFYWHIFKAYYRPEFALEEMNHVNFDWYAPKNAHRQTPEQVRAWCAEAGLVPERERVEEAGITVIARKAGA
jgi:SAM-dependent methyltransferase